MKNGVFWDVTSYGCCIRTEVSEEHSASFIGVTRLGDKTWYIFAACVGCEIPRSRRLEACLQCVSQAHVIRQCRLSASLCSRFTTHASLRTMKKRGHCDNIRMPSSFLCRLARNFYSRDILTRIRDLTLSPFFLEKAKNITELILVSHSLFTTFVCSHISEIRTIIIYLNVLATPGYNHLAALCTKGSR
jgi:hypothetical protein